MSSLISCGWHHKAMTALLTYCISLDFHAQYILLSFHAFLEFTQQWCLKRSHYVSPQVLPLRARPHWSTNKRQCLPLQLELKSQIHWQKKPSLQQSPAFAHLLQLMCWTWPLGNLDPELMFLFTGGQKHHLPPLLNPTRMTMVSGLPLVNLWQTTTVGRAH